VPIRGRRWKRRGRDGDKVVGGYEIFEELGRGGMGTTYRACRLSDQRSVALKVPHQTGDPTYRERFFREGKLGERLHHPGIVRILEIGEDDGVDFLAMELLAGSTLRQTLDDQPDGLPVDRVINIAHDIAEALDYAHTKGVVHRDLKPENVMVLPGGQVKVMDFGVARIQGQPGLTTSQFFFGSPVYSAPELVEPKSIDHRVDLYSLGIMLFEMLAGQPPFVHESIFRVVEMHQKTPLPVRSSLQPDVPAELWAIVVRLCAKAPDARPATAQALLADLKLLLFAPGAASQPAVVED
jgi:serine/threonine protein kinase